MMKKILLIVSGVALIVPIWIFGQTVNSSSSLVTEPCLVRVYNTGFMLPPEGGSIIRLNGNLYFARTYAPGCESSTAGAEIITPGTPISNAPPTTNPPTQPGTGGTGGTAVVNILTGDPCFVPVYNTNFMFPPEGGAVIRVGTKLYFVPTYMPRCAGATSQGEIVRFSTDVNPPVVQDQTGGGSVINFAVGNACLVPVYNTNFMFPPEGGAVVRIGGKLYFVPTYKPGCATVASQGEIVRSSTDTNPPVVQDTTGGGSVINFAVGNICLVPVYNTNFMFPPEGGKIETINGHTYFVKTYIPGCENL